VDDASGTAIEHSEGAMTDTDGPGPADVAPAAILYDLALEYSERAQRAEAALVAAFAAEAAALVAETGPITVDDDDDEQLELRADGVFMGAVLDSDSGDWVAIETPEDVVRYYDPTDVFLDLAAAIAESFPGVEDEVAGWAVAPDRVTDVRTAPEDAPGPASMDRDAEPGAAGPAESATMTMLRDLQRSGALSDADVERLRSDLHLKG
jgi:hypothetical protein